MGWPKGSEPNRTPDGEARTASERDLERERGLVARVLTGERRAAGVLHRALQPVVTRTLHRILGRGETERDDLLQQSFEQIVRPPRESRFSHACPLSAWATTVTARVALTELRRRYRHRRHFNAAAPPRSGREKPPWSGSVSAASRSNARRCGEP